MDSPKNISFYNDPAIRLVQPVAWEEPKKLQSALKQSIRRAVEHLGVTDNSGLTSIELEIPKDESFGDFSTNIAMNLARTLKSNPRELATKIVTELENDKEFKALVSKIEVAGPGFINFTLNSEVLFDRLLQRYNAPEKLNTGILKGKRILLEYAHPNPFKAFHIGHLRNIILGESLLRILTAMGAEVLPINYQGDVGMHIAKCLWAFQKVSPGQYPTDKTERVKLIAKCYAEGAEAYKDPEKMEEIKEINRKIYSKEDTKINELWDLGKQWSLDKFHELYNRVYTKFEREYMESEVLENCLQYIQEAVSKGVLEKSDGAIVFKGEKYGLDTRVFLNSQGLPTYEGKELGLAHLEFTDWGNIDLCIHNVAVEQISFFKVTFKVQALLDPAKYEGRQYHNAYEFVGLKSGKMSSRTGNVVLGEDILDEGEKMIRKILAERENFTPEQIDETAEKIGVGAIKYSFLNISPRSYLAFDLEKSLTFEGDSGPYLQYTYARANKILRDGGEFQPLSTAVIVKLEQNQETLSVVKQLGRFEDTVIEAGKHLSPNLLTGYLFDLAQKFNLFYKKYTILKEADPAMRTYRLMLTTATVKTMEQGLDLLGIKTVKEM